MAKLNLKIRDYGSSNIHQNEIREKNTFKEDLLNTNRSRTVSQDRKRIKRDSNSKEVK